MMNKLDKVKHAPRILACLGTGPKLFHQVFCETSIDQVSVRTALAKLVKLGYVAKDSVGRYTIVQDPNN